MSLSQRPLPGVNLCSFLVSQEGFKQTCNRIKSRDHSVSLCPEVLLRHCSFFGVNLSSFLVSKEDFKQTSNLVKGLNPELIRILCVPNYSSVTETRFFGVNLSSFLVSQEDFKQTSKRINSRVNAYSLCPKL